MARGVTKKTTWKKGDPRAVAAGKKSSHNKLSEETMALRAETVNDIESCAYKYLKLPLADLKNIFADQTLPFLDMIIIRTLIKGLEMGDFGHLEPILQRSVGKVKDQIEIKQRVESYHQLTLEIKHLSYEEKRQKYFEILKGSKGES